MKMIIVFHLFQVLIVTGLVSLITFWIATRSSHNASQISNHINSFLVNLESNHIRQKMKNHYISMGLMNSHGKWAHQRIRQVGFILLPGNVTKYDLMELVEQMAANAIKNPYTAELIKELDLTKYTKVMHRINRDGHHLVPEVITLALVLEKLTLMLSNDWKLFATCHRVWKRYNNFKKLILTYDLVDEIFKIAKVLSVQETVQRSLEAIEKRKVNPTFHNNELVVNILEAVKEDERLGNHDNALVGTTLAKYPCGVSKFDPLTGAGPTTLSSNQQITTCRPPLPLEWANLYQAWNIVFVTKFPDFPYYLPKLLIPSVSGYQDKPENYMGTRVIALYAFINFKINSRDLDRLDWADPHLTKDLGQLNLKAREDYIEKLASAKHMTTKQIKSGQVPNFFLSLTKFIFNSIF